MAKLKLNANRVYTPDALPEGAVVLDAWCNDAKLDYSMVRAADGEYYPYLPKAQKIQTDQVSGDALLLPSECAPSVSLAQKDEGRILAWRTFSGVQSARVFEAEPGVLKQDFAERGEVVGWGYEDNYHGSKLASACVMIYTHCLAVIHLHFGAAHGNKFSWDVRKSATDTLDITRPSLGYRWAAFGNGGVGGMSATFADAVYCANKYTQLIKDKMVLHKKPPRYEDKEGGHWHHAEASVPMINEDDVYDRATRNVKFRVCELCGDWEYTHARRGKFGELCDSNAGCCGNHGAAMTALRAAELRDENRHNLPPPRSEEEARERERQERELYEETGDDGGERISLPAQQPLLRGL